MWGMRKLTSQLWINNFFLFKFASDSKAENPGMGSGFSRGWNFYLCPLHTRHHRGSQGRLQASRPARVHSFLCPPKALHLVAMATCCQEQAASLHELQHPFVVHSIPSWSAASPPGSQHPLRVAPTSVPGLWSWRCWTRLHIKSEQGNGSVLFGKAITNIWVCCCHKQSCTHSAHSVSKKKKKLNWDVYSGVKKESDPFPAGRLKVLKGWNNTPWDFFLGFLLFVVTFVTLCPSRVVL